MHTNTTQKSSAQSTTDRDLETKKRMLGYVHRRTTDHDPALDKNLQYL